MMWPWELHFTWDSHHLKEGGPGVEGLRRWETSRCLIDVPKRRKMAGVLGLTSWWNAKMKAAKNPGLGAGECEVLWWRAWEPGKSGNYSSSRSKSKARNATQGGTTQRDHWASSVGNSAKCFNMEEQRGSIEKTRESYSQEGLGGGGA